MKYDEIHDDLSRQFAAIAIKFIPVLQDRSVEVCDLVQEGLILASEICSTYKDQSDRQLKSVAVVSFVNYLKDFSKLRKRRSKSEDNTKYKQTIEVLSDETAPERMMFRIFIRELGDILSRLDANVLNELLEPNKSARFAIEEKRSKRVVSVSEIHIARAFNKNLYEVRQSIQRVRSAVANEFFLN